MKRYAVVLIPDPEEGEYIGMVPTLPGCITEGGSLEEALENARGAVRLYLDDLAAEGEPVPEEATPPELAAVEVWLR